MNKPKFSLLNVFDPKQSVCSCLWKDSLTDTDKTDSNTTSYIDSPSAVHYVLKGKATEFPKFLYNSIIVTLNYHKHSHSFWAL